MTGDWVDPHTQQSSGDVEQERLDSKEISKGNVKGDGGGNISKLMQAHGLWIHKQWTQSVEGRLQDHPEDFLQSSVENLPFNVSRHIDINDINSLRIVVLKVVLLESHARRQALSTVSNHAKHFIVNRGFETQVVRQFVVTEREPVSQRSAKAPAQKKPLPSIKACGVNGQA
eukprot:CAMPEP_0176013568 /NCGR_PEP_ID=MMETSP0120_2-20121206/6375_1 /TAXON_ID=160619 /ORGANISM="Kryptoperidinium foliaceum, Strain CCMP 1326" /LENGTH=171 /DNA_ID=CAMNT_0017346483 /DNA_START=210 /DNA_END=725 /DNA_ORIENTATION=+